jgi:hypothetical protein
LANGTCPLRPFTVLQVEIVASDAVRLLEVQPGRVAPVPAPRARVQEVGNWSACDSRYSKSACGHPFKRDNREFNAK